MTRRQPGSALTYATIPGVATLPISAGSRVGSTAFEITVPEAQHVSTAQIHVSTLTVRRRISSTGLHTGFEFCGWTGLVSGGFLPRNSFGMYAVLC
jgi:hypothetical protein